MTNIFNDLKRLERIGSENSRATQKLHESAARIAAIIVQQCPEDVILPGYYQCVPVRTEQSEYYRVRLVRAGNVIGAETEDTYRDADGNEYRGRSRDASLQFAAYVASGLIDEISEWLEKRKAETEKAESEMVEAAK